MKKTYINPELEIIRLQTISMLADSAHIDINSDTENQIEDGEFLGRDSDYDW